MFKKREPLGSHVKFTKYSYIPYADAVDLVNSEEFRKEVKLAVAERRKRTGEQHA